MTDPTRPNPTRPADESPAMGDHPDLETDQGRRKPPPRRGDRLPSMVVAGIVALVLIVAMIVLVVI